jgi:hypothetical protein
MEAAPTGQTFSNIQFAEDGTRYRVEVTKDDEGLKVWFEDMGSKSQWAKTFTDKDVESITPLGIPIDNQYLFLIRAFEHLAPSFEEEKKEDEGNRVSIEASFQRGKMHIKMTVHFSDIYSMEFSYLLDKIELSEAARLSAIIRDLEDEIRTMKEDRKTGCDDRVIMEREQVRRQNTDFTASEVRNASDSAPLFRVNGTQMTVLKSGLCRFRAVASATDTHYNANNRANHASIYSQTQLQLRTNDGTRTIGLKPNLIFENGRYGLGECPSMFLQENDIILLRHTSAHQVTYHRFDLIVEFLELDFED